MEPITASAATKTFISAATALGKAALPELRRLHDERAAARSGPLFTPDALDRLLDEALGHLCAVPADDAWWRRLLDGLKIRYVRPDFLAAAGVQEWLSDEATRTDLKAEAAVRLMLGRAAGPERLERLAERYARHVGDAPALAAGPIAAVLDVMLAGAWSGLGRETVLLAGLAQAAEEAAVVRHEALAAGNAAIEEKVDRILGRMPPVQETGRLADPVVAAAHTREADAQLAALLRRRAMVVEGTTSAAIMALLERVTQGDLRHAAAQAGNRVTYWAARLLSQQAGALNEARRLRARLPPRPDNDLAVLDALVAAAEGDVEGALSRVRDREDADARSAVLHILARHRGPGAATEWLDALGPPSGMAFTPLGWRNAAVVLAEAGRWEDAAALLAAAPEEAAAECPDIHYLAGLANTALLLPCAVRARLLESGPFEAPLGIAQTSVADAAKARAIAAFERAALALREVGLDARAMGAEKGAAWLLLADPATREHGRRLVAERLRDAARGMAYVSLACEFEVPVDVDAVERRLRLREATGTLDPDELSARLALLRREDDPARLLRFLDEQGPALVDVLPPGAQADLRIKALVRAGRLEEAEAALDRAREALGDDHGRYADMIAANRGDDPVPSLERRFEQTGDDVDLLNLCNCLDRRRDPERLLSHGEELFRRVPNVENAFRVVHALERLGRHSEVPRFLGERPELTERSDDLLAAEAWALYRSGEALRAAPLCGRLLAKRDRQEDAALSVDIAVATGDWERLPGLLDREWQRRVTRDPRHLIRVAVLTADRDRDGATRLAADAADRAPGDPDILVAAADLASRLGRDDLAMPWIATAANLSDTGGPVRTFGLRETVELFRGNAERTKGVWDEFAAARVPIHFACALLNLPLAQVLLVQPRRNGSEGDPRRRTLIPVAHGGRPPAVDASRVRTVALDLTSLYLLAGAGMLDRVERRFDRIAIPPSTLFALLAEAQRCRFHQPSRIAGAKRLRALVDAGHLGVLQKPHEAPRSLVEEVGPEMAEALVAAERAGGRVVHPAPLHRAGSLGDEHADLGERAALVLTTVQLVGELRRSGGLALAEANTALAALRSADRGAPSGPDACGTGPLVLTGLAVSYIAQAGLLERLRLSGRQILVHPDTLSETTALIATEVEAEPVLGTLDALRLWLRRGMRSGKVRLLPQMGADQDEEDDSDRRFWRRPEVATLRELLGGFGASDAVVVDDRTMGAHRGFADRSGRTALLLGVFDVLRELARSGELSQEDLFGKLHELRLGGLVCAPVFADELEQHLLAADMDAGTGAIRETAELRGIRESVARLRSGSLLQLPAEAAYTDWLTALGVGLIHRTWRDGAVRAELAAARATWVWSHVVPLAADWAHAYAGAGLDAVSVTAQQIAALLFPPMTDPARRTAFASWWTRQVLRPFETRGDEVLDAVMRAVEAKLEEWADGLTDDRP